MTPFFQWIDTAGGWWPEVIVTLTVAVWACYRLRPMVREWMAYRRWQSLRRPQRERVRP